MESLALQIQPKDSAGTEHWEWVTLNKDTNITIEMSSPIFGTGATFSYPFTIPMEPNRHIIGNADQIHGSHLHDLLHGCPARLYLCGVPFRKGIIKLDKEVKVTPETGEIEIEFTSERGEWEDIIDGLNARDVELLERFQIGFATPEKLDMAIKVGQIAGGFYAQTGRKPDGNLIESWHRDMTQMAMAQIMTPKDKNGSVLVNLHEPFNPAVPTAYPYCTMRVCVQKRATKSGGNAENADDEEEKRGYNVLGYDRFNTGICMYVGYFLRSLFKHVGVALLDNGLEDIEDFRRLFFLSTQCHYEVDAGEANDLAPSFKDIGISVTGGLSGEEKYIAMGCTGRQHLQQSGYLFFNGEYIDEETPITDISFSQKLLPAYATKENFPDKDVREVINAIEKAFCARLVFDSAAATARIVLLRDVLRDTSVDELYAEVLSVEKTENNTRGVKLTYGESSDTAFNYKHDETSVMEVEDYSKLIRSISAHDRTLYYNPVNGKEYRIKVDGNAKSESELHPSLFEVEQFADSINGDCSDEESTTVITMGFTPATMNDVNFENEKTGKSDQQTFAFFVPDAEIHTTANKQVVRNTIGLCYDYEWKNTRRISASDVIPGGEIKEIPVYITYRTGQNWDMADSFDGPLQDYDAGLTLCVNRGPGGDGGVVYFDLNYDGEGNSRWAITPKNYASHSDACDDYGRQWDYNGNAEGLQDGANGAPSGRFSLCLRAEKPNPFFDPSKPEGEVTSVTTYTGGTEQATTADRAEYVLKALLPADKADPLLVYFIMRHKRLKEYEYDTDPTDYPVAFWPLFYDITDDQGVTHHALLSPWYIDTHQLAYKPNLEMWIGLVQGRDVATIKKYVGACLVELDSTEARGQVIKGLLELIRGISSTPVTVTLPSGTFTTTSVNNRFLDITDPNNRRRGVGEQFYSEFIHWELNKRLLTCDVNIELAELLRIDLAKRYHLWDVTGFINKVQVHADMTGIKDAKVEMYYI